jgi:lactate dehydrogenase-like 2-hydroxyacid dehydrogenase
LAKPDVLVIEPMLPMVTAALQSAYQVHFHDNPKDPAGLPDAVRPKIRALATFGATGAARAVIDALPALEIAACFGVGVDAIDTARCRERGIKVTNTPDVLTDCVADMGVALLLAVQRRVVEGDAYVRTGKWLQANMPLTHNMGRRKAGIFGMGRIGQAVARRLIPFGCEIHYSGPRPKPELPYTYHPKLADMARAVDFLLLTCPGGAATRHAVNAEVIAALGPKGTLVNISRGSVVDQKALVAALTSGKLGQAALDVFEDEPNVPAELMGLTNVVLQPHASSATEETRAAMGQLVVDNIAAHFAGKPLLTPV